MPRFTLFLTNLSLIALHATIQSRLNRYPQISLSQFILSEIDRPELFTFQIISNGLVDSFEAKDATIESLKKRVVNESSINCMHSSQEITRKTNLKRF
jgi:hypothetical protein